MYVQTNAAEALRFKSRQGSDALVCGSLRTRSVDTSAVVRAACETATVVTYLWFLQRVRAKNAIQKPIRR
jgi:hypothetical protein